jgi:hypothetical protein
MSIEQELVSLTDADGFIKPHRVVEWARKNPESELHKRFEWDNKTAADEYRLYQARRLIAVHVVSSGGQRQTISLIQDRTPDRGYRHIEPVMKNADLREAALRQALDELRRWEAKYQYLQELAEMFEARARIEARLVERKMKGGMPIPVPPSNEEGAASAA